MRGRARTGDGDTCPVTPSHESMCVIRGTSTQYCPDQSHDGAPKSAPGGPRPATRAFWPNGWKSFAAAVAEYTARTAGEAAQRLPDLGSIELPDLEGVDL